MPISVDAIFNIASMTKPVTSVAVMMLLEQGKLSLEDPVSKFLSGFDHLQVITKFNEADGTYETRPAKRVMTLRTLLTHTSGIGYGFSSPILARLQQGADDKKEWEFPLLHDPGEKWTYGASTRVLGLIVERITGETLEAYYQEHIFGPLRMVDSSYAVPADKQSRVVRSYEHVAGEFKEEQSPWPIPVTPTPPFRGDGGLYSTARDYGRFMRMLLNGGRLGNVRILSERSVHLMAENQIGPIFVSLQPVGISELTRPFPLGAGRDKFGLGFQVTAESADTAKYRRAGSLSWAGLFNTEFWVDPPQRSRRRAADAVSAVLRRWRHPDAARFRSDRLRGAGGTLIRSRAPGRPRVLTVEVLWPNLRPKSTLAAITQPRGCDEFTLSIIGARSAGAHWCRSRL